MKRKVANVVLLGSTLFLISPYQPTNPWASDIGMNRGKDELLGTLTSRHVEYLCDKDEPFLQCLQIGENRCVTDLLLVAKTCAARHSPDMPYPLDSMEDVLDFQKFGTSYGSCLIDTGLEQIASNLESAIECLDMEAENVAALLIKAMDIKSLPIAANE